MFRVSLIVLCVVLNATATEFQVLDEGPANVRLAVYFEALCYDSVNFFKNQLLPTYELVGDIIDLELIPFGKASASPYLSDGRVNFAFECQHGPRECAGNRVMSCAGHVLGRGAAREVLGCMMAARDPSSAGEQCAVSLGLPWEEVELCSRSRLGSALLYLNGRRTADLRPRLNFVPTVTVNGLFSRASLHEVLGNLLAAVCSAYEGHHPNCPPSVEA